MSGWAWIAGFVLVGLLVGLLHAWVTRPTYRATALLLVTPTATAADATAAYDANLLAQRLAGAYAKLMQGPEFAGLVVAQMDLRMSPRALQSALNVSPVPDSNLLTASVTLPNPGQAQSIANALGPLFAQHFGALGKPNDTGSGAKVLVAASAVRPTGAVSPRPARDAGLTGALGLLIGLAVAYGRRRRMTLLQRVTEFEERTGTPVVAVLPGKPQRAREGVRELRAHLRAETDGAAAWVAVAGIGDSRGPGWLAEELAQSFLDIDGTALLIRADPAVPSNGRQDRPALVDVVLGRATLRDAVVPGRGHRPDVVHAGVDEATVTDVLASAAMPAVLTEAGAEYDAVVVLCPPMEDSAAALTVGSQGGHVLLVPASSEFRDSVLDPVLRRFTQARVPLAGMVLVQDQPRTVVRLRGWTQQGAVPRAVVSKTATR